MYSLENLQRLRLGYLTVGEAYFNLMMKCLSFETRNEKSREYIHHGFLRRLGILQRCIQNVYHVYPPERSDIPSRNECLDITINLQSFVFNVFGCIDNLAWVWVTEKKLKAENGKPIRPVDVTFRKEIVAQTLPDKFQEYLDSLKKWFKYLEEFRHARAHRIPLYIPPYTVSPTHVDEHNNLERKKGVALQRRDHAEYERLDAEQIKLGRFTPAMTHSHSESSGSIAFHSQLIADWNTVVEIAGKFFEILDKPSDQGSKA